MTKLPFDYLFLNVKLPHAKVSTSELVLEMQQMDFWNCQHKAADSTF